MDNTQQIAKAHDGHGRNTALFFAATDLESATYAARKAREDLRRATRNRLQAKERHDNAANRWRDAGDGTPAAEVQWVRVDLTRWALENAETAELDALNDYRDALKRIEVVGATAGEADSHAVPAYVRHRARKAIALADSFGNKVAMDATQFDGLERPVLPELEPEVEVQEFRVIDPLEPVEAWIPPEPRAVLVPVDDYSPTDLQMVQHALKAANGETEAERFAAWLELNPLAKVWETDVALEEFRRWERRDEEDENLAPVCPECRDGKHGNCDGTAWDDQEDAIASCSCLVCESAHEENAEGGR